MSFFVLWELVCIVLRVSVVLEICILFMELFINVIVDFFVYSNYIELVLIEMGECDVFFYIG